MVVENGPRLLALLNRFEIMLDSKGDVDWLQLDMENGPCMPPFKLPELPFTLLPLELDPPPENQRKKKC